MEKTGINCFPPGADAGRPLSGGRRGHAGSSMFARDHLHPHLRQHQEVPQDLRAHTKHGQEQICKHRMIIFEYKVLPSILGLQTRFAPRDVALPPPLQEPSDDLPKVYFDKKSVL